MDSMDRKLTFVGIVFLLGSGSVGVGSGLAAAAAAHGLLEEIHCDEMSRKWVCGLKEMMFRSVLMIRVQGGVEGEGGLLDLYSRPSGLLSMQIWSCP